MNIPRSARLGFNTQCRPRAMDPGIGRQVRRRCAKCGSCLEWRGRQSPEAERDLDWLTGSLLMIRRECIEEVGLSTKRIFVYEDDVDLTLLRRSGRDRSPQHGV